MNSSKFNTTNSSYTVVPPGMGVLVGAPGVSPEHRGNRGNGVTSIAAAASNNIIGG